MGTKFIASSVVASFSNSNFSSLVSLFHMASGLFKSIPASRVDRSDSIECEDGELTAKQLYPDSF